ncbi:phage major tail tube protein [Thalassolituus oleivorans]|uniref:phage major tail tube protein n=1 Tax=Thalassolituus oleivorans TaxID=187493 RepID=UPI0023F498FA|nr:phage major tail tube protein [Thalassolituus oleivorans]
MALPRKLKFYQLSADGKGYLHDVPELTLPKLARKMVDYMSGGMDSPIKSDMGGEPMTMDWTCAGMLPEVFGQFAAQKHDAIGLRFSGAYQSDDSEAVQTVEISVRGRHSEIDSGTAKRGEDTAIKVTSELSYYKLTVDAKVWLEIDVINMVYIVDGKDLYADHRTALGL